MRVAYNESKELQPKSGEYFEGTTRRTQLYRQRVEQINAINPEKYLQNARLPCIEHMLCSKYLG